MYWKNQVKLIWYWKIIVPPGRFQDVKGLPRKGFRNLTVSDEVYRLLEAYKTANGLRSLSQAVGKILEKKQEEAALPHPTAHKKI